MTNPEAREKVLPAMAEALQARVPCLHVVRPVPQLKDATPDPDREMGMGMPMLANNVPVEPGYDLAAMDLSSTDGGTKQKGQRRAFGFDCGRETGEEVRIWQLLPGQKYRDSCLRLVNGLLDRNEFAEVEDTYNMHMGVDRTITMAGNDFRPIWSIRPDIPENAVMVMNPAYIPTAADRRRDRRLRGEASESDDDPDAGPGGSGNPNSGRW